MVVTKPHFRNQEQHGQELANEFGRIGNEVYTYLDFQVGGKTYSAWWKSHTFAAPVYLSKNLRYKFRLLLERKSSECQVVAIWRGDKLLGSTLKHKNQRLHTNGHKT